MFDITIQAPDLYVYAAIAGDPNMNKVTTVDYGTDVWILNDANTPFQDIHGNPIDPDCVYLILWVNGVTPPTLFTYKQGGTGDPTGTIVRDGLGFYHAVLSSRIYGSGTWQGVMGGEPVESIDHDTTDTSSARRFEVYVKPPPYDFPTLP